MCADKLVKKQHFVNFCSPGTFVSEESTTKIKAWNVDDAIVLANNVTERYNATPYGFYFTTYGRGVNDLNSKEIDRSNMYYLGGEIQTLEQIKSRNDPKDAILICNMECNDWDRVLVNANSWAHTAVLNEADVVLEYTPPKREKV